jgi:hypothetical protein
MQIRRQSLRAPAWRVEPARSILARLTSFFLVTRLDERLMDVFDTVLMRKHIPFGETNAMTRNRDAAVMVRAERSLERKPEPLLREAGDILHCSKGSFAYPHTLLRLGGGYVEPTWLLQARTLWAVIQDTQDAPGSSRGRELNIIIQYRR